MRQLRRIAVLALVLSGTAVPAAAEGLQPYQMVRSLQHVQDRIAGGDHAAVPMQARLLGIIDERLRKAAQEDFEDPRNLHALLIYGASGGNPATLEMVVSSLNLDGEEQVLGQGVVHYTRGDLARARDVLRDLEPLALDNELAAPLALLTGSLLVTESPVRALRLFDEARLVSPGTLIEEAALRRTVAVSATLGDAERVGMASLQYVRRFLHSPYASQFAETFVSAVVALHETIDLALVEEVAAAMNVEQAHTIYLRIARASAIDGHERLLGFASRSAERFTAGEDEPDPRAVLYTNLVAVGSEDVSTVLQTLEGIDPRGLSANDRRLLRAGQEIARRVVAPPAKPAPARAEEEEADPVHTAFVARRMEMLEAVDARLEEARP